MNSSENLKSASSGTVKLVVKGLGHIPAIKNSMFSIVKKENREWKRRCVQNFLSQLISSLPTTESGTVTPLALQSLIASLPPDDNWQVIPSIRIEAQKVEPGEEGATIVIERI